MVPINLVVFLSRIVHLTHSNQLKVAPVKSLRCNIQFKIVEPLEGGEFVLVLLPRIASPGKFGRIKQPIKFWHFKPVFLKLDVIVVNELPQRGLGFFSLITYAFGELSRCEIKGHGTTLNL